MNPALARHLAPSLLLALLAGSVGGLLLWAAQHSHARAQQETRLAREAAQALQQQRRQTQQEEGSIRAAVAAHDALRRSGLMGAEDRLSWLEVLRAGTDRLRLSPPDFSLAPQRQLAAPASASDFRFQASAMKLAVGLLHEADLLTLLDSLYELPSVFVLAQGCSLQARSAAGSGGHSGVHAQCQLEWITVAAPAKP